jgi:hypothetical protein
LDDLRAANGIGGTRFSHFGCPAKSDQEPIGDRDFGWALTMQRSDSR